jgi:hypothetical protein
MPCLHVLPREDLRALLPQIVALSSEEVIAAFRRILEVWVMQLTRTRMPVA